MDVFVFDSIGGRSLRNLHLPTTCGSNGELQDLTDRLVDRAEEREKARPSYRRT